MKKLAIYILLIVFAFHASTSLAQSNRSKKLNKGSSKTEIKKRQKEASTKQQKETPFAPPTGTGSDSQLRDDLIWKPQTANTSNSRSGNISLSDVSRYSYKSGIEFQSILPLFPLAPNFFIKKRWYSSTWKIASRHGLYTASPGYLWAKNQNYSHFADSSSSVPVLIGFKNELLVSRLFADKYSCSSRQPYLILSSGLGVDVGTHLGSNSLTETQHHFLTNRTTVLIGKGYYLYIFVRADYQYNSTIMLSANLTYFNGSFQGNYAWEQKSNVELFLNSKLSASVGYKLSLANYNTSNSIGIIPWLDICWYFGEKQGHQKGLFDKRKLY